ncbi:DMT family transporter [Paenibacillus sp. CC-CFT747]|nr:DMT family transporter [Paenibacillus sp. CC-CFT747]
MKSPRLLILTFFTMLAAGINFPVGKMALSFGSPFVVLAIRFVGAGLLMLPFLWRRPHPQSAALWLKLAVIGLFQSALVMAGIYCSMQTIPSGSASSSPPRTRSGSLSSASCCTGPATVPFSGRGRS